MATSLLIAGGVVAASSPVATAAARRASVTVPGTAFAANAIVCPTATNCLAGGSSSSGGVIVSINGSNGAAAVTGTDTATGGAPFSGISCPTATDCVAVAGLADSARVVVSNGTLGPNHYDSADTSIYNAVVCPNAKRCYAGGTRVSSGPSFTTTLTHLTATAVAKATTEGQPGQIDGLACVSATRCYAAVANGSGGDVLVLARGKVEHTFPTSFDGEAITCFEAESCVEVGNIGETIYAASVNPTTGDPGTPILIKNMSEVMGVTCATSTECFAVGYLVRKSELSARVSDIANGEPASAQALPGQSLSGVACSTPTTCWAIGEDSTGTGIVDSVPVP